MPHITLCADDFGMNDAIDTGILSLAHARRINAISAMSQGPTFEDNAPSLRALKNSIGLHLDLTEFAPGAPPSLLRLHTMAYTRRLDMAWIRQTISDQLDAFERGVQRRPQHVDGHRHIHQLPGVREALMDCLRKRYGEAMPRIRTTLRQRTPGQPWRTRIKAGIIERMGGRALDRLCRMHATPTFGRFAGIYDFGRQAPGVEDTQIFLQARYGHAMRQWISHATRGDLIMCHPAHPALIRAGTQPDEHGDPIAQDRMAEFSVLTSAVFAQWLHEADVQFEQVI